MRKLLLAAFAAFATIAPAKADQLLGQGRIDNSSRVILPGGPTLGRWQGNKYTATPDALVLPSTDQGSTGNLSGMSVTPSVTASANTLARLLGDLSGFKAPGLTGFANLDAAYFTLNSRTLINSPPSGPPTNWLGNAAGGSASQYAYGGIGQTVSLSGIGDVGIVGATRTTDMTSSGRLPIGTMGWGFNFRTDGSVVPLTSAWGGYFEARRKTGAGSAQAMEINVTELGSTDVADISAKNTAPNAYFNYSSAALNLASGGNCTTFAGSCWDGTKLANAVDASVALVIHGNGAKFRKGLIFAQDGLTGCDGAGGKACTAIEAGRGATYAWIDSTLRQAAKIRADVSPSGDPLGMTFTDGGVQFDGGGAVTMQVAAKASDVNGMQVQGGSAAGNPARLVAVGSANASLALSPSGTGTVQMQAPVQLAMFSVATLPACNASREGAMAYVNDARNITYRGALTGGGAERLPVFCSGTAWEAH
ncbi:hypothetical protein [Methylobacterium sp. Leaf117]|uniref:hypothetical protein n=1 Tax=Methylobacterium sp. Leaf117 TaxID=1736260 RepID=UPI0006F712A0|nr:hypothetical protein [Methylobacterium sp. Leaf117]KQP82847.1 hypothetical protein ASF57_11975 [Methylobacterium sp. Leaf117]